MPIPERLTATGAALLVIDIQERLIRLIRRGDLVVANADRLIRAAQLLNVPVLATEQYPKGLGPTVDALIPLLPERREKTLFHAADAARLDSPESDAPIRHVTLVGIEAHVCVMQTALELLRRGFKVQIPTDAVASRGEEDYRASLRRLESSGATITTTEAVLFEWTERSDHPSFKAISALVKDFQPPPVQCRLPDRGRGTRP